VVTFAQLNLEVRHSPPPLEAKSIAITGRRANLDKRQVVRLEQVICLFFDVYHVDHFAAALSDALVTATDQLLAIM
jgi:hypothetical protein